MERVGITGRKKNLSLDFSTHYDNKKKHTGIVVSVCETLHNNFERPL